MAKEGSRKNIINLSLQDPDQLYRSYIPALKNGGLFIQTEKSYRLGDEVFLLLTLMDEPEKIPVAGNVAWITPPGSHSNRPSGIGIHFSDSDKGQTRKKIETYLVTRLNSDEPTYTL